MIFSIHGGALEIGDRREETFVVSVRRRRYLTVVKSYRLSPQVSHPAHIRCRGRLAWVTRNIKAHGATLTESSSSATPQERTWRASGRRFALSRRAHLSPDDIKGLVPVSGFFWSIDQAWRPTSPLRVGTIDGLDRILPITLPPCRFATGLLIIPTGTSVEAEAISTWPPRCVRPATKTSRCIRSRAVHHDVDRQRDGESRRPRHRFCSSPTARGCEKK